MHSGVEDESDPESVKRDARTRGFVTRLKERLQGWFCGIGPKWLPTVCVCIQYLDYETKRSRDLLVF
jgi:hypothetical protein